MRTPIRWGGPTAPSAGLGAATRASRTGSPASWPRTPPSRPLTPFWSPCPASSAWTTTRRCSRPSPATSPLRSGGARPRYNSTTQGRHMKQRAIVYSEAGGSEVLQLVERPVPEPAPGEVRVAVRVSGVNPTDWKSRRGASATGGGALAFAEIVPNQDGAGVVDAVGEGVQRLAVGDRVWVWEAAWQRPGGTAQEY